jgi:hypothetical protein
MSILTKQQQVTNLPSSPLRGHFELESEWHDESDSPSTQPVYRVFILKAPPPAGPKGGLPGPPPALKLNTRHTTTHAGKLKSVSGFNGVCRGHSVSVPGRDSVTRNCVRSHGGPGFIWGLHY